MTDDTEPKKSAFLAALTTGATVESAAAAAGFSRRTAYAKRAADPAFAAAWDHALGLEPEEGQA
jgi:hypothetical protein